MAKSKPESIEDIANVRRERILALTEKRVGKDRIHMGDAPELFLGTIPTDVPQLDAILGGGLRRGRIAIATGEASMGKTLVTQWVIKAFQARGLLCGFIDPEKTFDAEWFEKTGIDVKSLMVVRPNSTEQAFDVACDWVKAGVDLVVIDSMAALTPKARMESGLEEKEVMGRSAFKIGEGMNKLNNDNLDSVVFCTNQLRTKFGVTYGSPDVMPGGRGQRFVASYILNIRRAEWIKEGEARVGQIVKITTDKSKLTPPHQTCEVPFMWTGVIDGLAGLIDLAQDLDILIFAKGGWCTWQGVKYQGAGQVKAHLEDHPDEVELLKELVGGDPSQLVTTDLDAMPDELEG